MSPQPTFSCKDKTLVVNGTSMEFAHSIEKCLACDHGVLVLLDHRVNDTRNVYLVGPDAKIKWQIDEFGATPGDGPNPYTGIYILENGAMEVYNLLGYLCDVDPMTGLLRTCEYAQH